MKVYQVFSKNWAVQFPCKWHRPIQHPWCSIRSDQ